MPFAQVKKKFVVSPWGSGTNTVKKLSDGPGVKKYPGRVDGRIPLVILKLGSHMIRKA